MNIHQADFVAVDWGTSNFRAFLMNNAGECFASVYSEDGILSVKNQSFKAVLKKNIEPWLSECHAIPIIMSGMVGSQIGWKNVPYSCLPFDQHSLVKDALRINDDGLNIWLIPGVRSTSRDGFLDVMRGEEVQVLGARIIANQHDFTLEHICLPGTHSKWLSANNNTAHLSTFMTGELFSLLKDHSILSKSIDIRQSWDNASFIKGVECATSHSGLLHQLFSVRTKTLLEHDKHFNARSYLSGLLIGSEINAMNCKSAQSIVVVAEPEIQALYKLALEQRACKILSINSSDASKLGLLAIYQSICR